MNDPRLMPMLSKEDLGRALRLLRGGKDLKQQEVAARAGLTKAMLSSYETGQKLPSFESLTRILVALSMDFHDLQEALTEVRAGIGARVVLQPKHLGRALKHLRSRQGLKQVTVADRAGVTKAMLSCYEKGHVLPSIENLEAVLTALGGDFHNLQDAMVAVAQEAPSL